MKIIATIAAAAGLAIAAPAIAGESITVEYKDLDLTTKAGQQTLDNRLDSAAKQVCGMNEQRTGTRIASRSARECYDSAKTQLNDQIAALVAKEARGG